MGVELDKVPKRGSRTAMAMVILLSADVFLEKFSTLSPEEGINGGKKIHIRSKNM